MPTRTKRIQVLGTESVNARPIGKESSNVEVRAATMGSGSQAPIKIVDECPWSLGVYRLLCLLGKTLEVVWVREFVQTYHF